MDIAYERQRNSGAILNRLAKLIENMLIIILASIRAIITHICITGDHPQEKAPYLRSWKRALP